MPLDPRIQLVPVLTRESRHGPRETVTVTGAVTHVLGFNMQSGGYLDSWTVDGVEILNRGDSYIRGLQATAMWTDAELGELTTHQLMQGGDYYSHPSLTGNPHGGGAPLMFKVTQPHYQAAARIEVQSVPVDLDPDGIFGKPGVRTSHGGDASTMADWDRMVLKTVIWINYLGDEGVHLIESGLWMPTGVLTGHFDVSLGTNLFLTGGANLRAYHPATTTDALLSNGTLGLANYMAEYRAYSTDGDTSYGDDDGPIAGPGFGTRTFGLGVEDVDPSVSVAVAGFLDPIGSGTDLNLDLAPHCNDAIWSQNRGDSTGHDEENYVMIGLRSSLTGRWHDHNSVRRINPGWTENHRFMFTGSTWAQVKSRMDDMYNEGYRKYLDETIPPERVSDVRT